MSSKRNIAIIGANGHLGPSILKALISHPTFTTTILTRTSSKSTYPPGPKIIKVSDDLPQSELIDALKGQDALVVTFMGSNSALQIRLADACVAAGVHTFIPADFGSCDSSSARALELVPLYGHKTKVREYLRTLEDKLSWTSLVCGHFFDYGMATGLLHFNVKEKKARLFDGGDIRASYSTMDRVGVATVRCLELEEETKNQMLFMQSFCVTQKDILKVLKEVVGEGWEIEEVVSDGYIKELKKEMDEKPNDGELTESMVGVVGIVDANWETRKGFAMELLGLENEDLGKVVRHVLES